MIKPEDIPAELVEHYLRSYVSKSWPEKIARDLNAAIQAGVVSPPVYRIRDAQGYLTGDFFTKDCDIKPWMRKGESVEHWKGDE